MKFKLYKELLNKNDIMSHVFLNCADESVHEIAAKNEGLTIEEIKNRDVEIELKIDGKECDPRKFFSLLWEQYEKQIRKEANKIVKEQTSEKFQEIQTKLQDFAEICDEWANDINWEVTNKFEKIN